MSSYIEHANITVADLDNTLAFLAAALPDFSLRHTEQADSDGHTYRWAHFGNDKQYIALQSAVGREQVEREQYSDVGSNHVGIVVDDTDALIARVAELGFAPSSISTLHPARVRVYFDLNDGTEWEFVQYLSTDPEKRNDYSQ